MKLKTISLLIITCALQNFLRAKDSIFNLPSFDDLKEIKEPTNETQSGKEQFFSGGNIVVTFDDNKVVPDLRTGNSSRVSVDFIDEDIKQVLRYISELYDLNIIIPTSLVGKVTIRLKDVTWQALLEAVLTPLGCSYIEKNGIVQIGSAETMLQEPLQTKTFLLKFADAKTLVTELAEFVDKDNKERVTFNERTNMLIWTGRSKNLQQVETIIEQLDKPETQVMIEAKFVEAHNNFSDDFGIQWPSSLTAYLDQNVASNATSSTTTSNAGGNAASTSSDDTHGQVSWGINHSKALKNHNIFVQTLNSTFNFSKTDDIGKTLSNPTIITMNNVPASMSVITKYPIPNYSYNSDQGQFEISGFEEKPIGIQLDVTPKVQAEYITLKLAPSLSTQDGTVPFTSGSGTSVSYPKIAEKKTSSIVTIKSGYAIAIGGLMSKSKTNTKTKVPLLGELPLIGTIFSNKSKKDELTNLMIFLSATQIAYDGTILYPHQQGVKNISQKRMFEAGMTDKDLPGEADLSEEEVKVYKDIHALQNKLDNVLDRRKALKAKRMIHGKIGRYRVKTANTGVPAKNRMAVLKQKSKLNKK